LIVSLFLAGLAVLIVAAGSVRQLSALGWILALASVGAFSGSLIATSVEFLDLSNNMLSRDLVAVLVLVALAPVLAATGAAPCRARAGWLRFTVSLSCGLVPLLAGPFILLMVHCTSGDCL
jgi:hypothetical protein